MATVLPVDLTAEFAPMEVYAMFVRMEKQQLKENATPAAIIATRVYLEILQSVVFAH